MGAAAPAAIDAAVAAGIRRIVSPHLVQRHARWDTARLCGGGVTGMPGDRDIQLVRSGMILSAALTMASGMGTASSRRITPYAKLAHRPGPSVTPRVRLASNGGIAEKLCLTGPKPPR
jgi:hypothetical protein